MGKDSSHHKNDDALRKAEHDSLPSTTSVAPSHGIDSASEGHHKSINTNSTSHITATEQSQKGPAHSSVTRLCFCVGRECRASFNKCHLVSAL